LVFTPLPVATFVPNPPGAKWMEGLPLSLEDRVKILSGNCERLLRM